ncbi:NADH dehydrogenase [ubiquinone] 1 alpha subcomplex subunit 9, mitochondrial-like protein [Drosera capensis]
MEKANVVINLIGREYETRNYSFEEVNHHMAEQLASPPSLLSDLVHFKQFHRCHDNVAWIAKEHGGIMRFLQVSCLGASSTSPSRLLRAKAAAEEAILRELPERRSKIKTKSKFVALFPMLGVAFKGWTWTLESIERTWFDGGQKQNMDRVCYEGNPESGLLRSKSKLWVALGSCKANVVKPINWDG